VVSGSKLCSKSCYSKGLCVVWCVVLCVVRCVVRCVVCCVVCCVLCCVLCPVSDCGRKVTWNIVGDSLKLFSVQGLYCLFDDLNVKAMSLNTLTSSFFITSNNPYLKIWIDTYFNASTICGLEKEHSGMLHAQEYECEGHLKTFCKGGSFIRN
jgi:hypothetical protein